MTPACLTLAIALLGAVPSQLPPPRDEADAQVAARLKEIERALDEGETAAQLWWSGWVFGLTTAAAGQAVASVSVSARAQPLFQVGALKAGLGAASVVLVPFPAAFGPAKLRAFRDGTAAERLEKLQTGEQLLRKAAAIERLGRSWVPRVGGLLLNSSASLWLWLREGRPASAAISFALGTAVGEVKIWTQPTAAIDAEALLAAPSAMALGQAPRGPALRWTLAPVPGGLLLAGAF